MNKKEFLAIILTFGLLSHSSVKPLSSGGVASLTALGSFVGGVLSGCKDKLNQGVHARFNYPCAFGGAIAMGILSNWISYKFTRHYYFEQAKEKMHLYLEEKELFEAALILEQTQDEGKNTYESFYKTIQLTHPSDPHGLVTIFLAYKDIKDQLLEAIDALKQAIKLEPNTIGYSNKKFKQECEQYSTILLWKIKVIDKAIGILTQHSDFQKQFYLYECDRLDTIEALAQARSVLIVHQP